MYRQAFILNCNKLLDDCFISVHSVIDKPVIYCLICLHISSRWTDRGSFLPTSCQFNEPRSVSLRPEEFRYHCLVWLDLLRKSHTVRVVKSVDICSDWHHQMRTSSWTESSWTLVFWLCHPFELNGSEKWLHCLYSTIWTETAGFPSGILLFITRSLDCRNKADLTIMPFLFKLEYHMFKYLYIYTFAMKNVYKKTYGF